MSHDTRTFASVNEYATPSRYATELCGHPSDELRDEPDWTYSDDEMNPLLAEVLDDQTVSKADALARAELADAKAWLKTLTADPVTICRAVSDSDLTGKVTTYYLTTIYATPYIYGHGDTAMESARHAAGQLNVAKVA